MKKGFTLVELLAVILIIAVLSIASGVAIFSIINDSRENFLEDQKKSALDSAITYVIRTKRYISSCNSEPAAEETISTCSGTGSLNCKCSVSISELSSSNIFENKNDICNPSGNIIVYKIDGELKAKFASEDVCQYK